ncbi:ATP-dependent DNA helicase RecQ [Rosistilla carotiformis]|uniref:DNA helicase RecQ n=1 Tax=Rosistilla carotiformis TaxID=2528017 RepID=A0A518K0M8_9BACT|nr:DNA helicase RecQ [Rosistilla carotiformis]QDV71356.1 ATP-dependent DNA helicase RecQ [Rosistilla carotiformis]
METQEPEEFSIESQLLAALERSWGYDAFRPLQREAMQCVMQHRDSVVVLPTGGGKSLCFQAPATCLDGMGVVVSPLISLMKDQVDALRSCGISAAYINSTLSADERREIADQIQAGELKLLYVAPERLVDARMIEFLKSAKVSMVAIDEAHCISAWGHDFRPEFRQLRFLKEAFPGVGVHAYTATASQQVREDIAQQLQLESPQMLVGGFDRPNLVYRVLAANNRFGQVCEVIQRHAGESGIVYCISRKEVDRTTENLVRLGFKAAPYHAGLSDTQRAQNQEAFLSEQVDVIVATVAFGMGIDKSNVRYVVHAGMPKSLEHYQQESGRAGRDGLEAECVLIYSGGDLVTWKRIMRGGDPSVFDSAVASLEAMNHFCASVSCRHRSIVRYFGQDLEAEKCGACDVCLDEIDLVDDATTIGQKILSNVLRTEERFGADYNAKCLVGSQEQRIVQMGHDKLSTYGLLSSETVNTVRGWIEQLVEQGFLLRSGEYNTISVTPSGRQLLRREVEPRLLRPANKEAQPKAASAESWEGVDRGLFEHLRQLRGKIAAEKKVPAYVVFGDVTLRDMARIRPSDVPRLMTVSGVGEKKQQDFGEFFLAEIASYCAQHDLQQDAAVATRAVKPVAKKPKALAASSLAAMDLFRNGMSLDDAVVELKRARSTVAGYLNDYLKHERVTDPTPWVETEVIQQIEAVLAETGLERLRPIFDALDGKVDYDSIRIVASCWSNRQGEAG